MCAGSALAAPPSEQTLACVSASTEGQVERDRGHLLSARTQFRACAQPACPSIVNKSCAEWLIDLDRRIPSVVVRVSERNEHDIIGASVFIDGAAVAFDGRPVQLDPGTHAIVASAPGWSRSERTFLLAEREQARLLVMELQSSKTPAPPRPDAVDPPRRESARFRVPVASWILGGLGVAGIVSFAVLRVQAGQEFAHLQKTCSPDCLPVRTERGRHSALAADLSLGIGVAAIAGAGAWALGSWLWGDKSSARVAWVPTHGGMFASAALRY
jgi:hypothetical protein